MSKKEPPPSKCEHCIDENSTRQENPNRGCDTCGPTYANYRPKARTACTKMDICDYYYPEKEPPDYRLLEIEEFRKDFYENHFLVKREDLIKWKKAIIRYLTIYGHYAGFSSFRTIELFEIAKGIEKYLEHGDDDDG